MPEAFEAAREALARGDNLFIFPEGTRRTPGRLGPIRGGLGILAQETRAPILPIFVRGTCAPRFGGNPLSPLEVRFGPLLRLHALARLLVDLDPKVVTTRIGDLFLSVLEELQARPRLTLFAQSLFTTLIRMTCSIPQLRTTHHCC